MAVPVGRRNLSPHEFVRTFKLLRTMVQQQMNKVPKRKQQYVVPQVLSDLYTLEDYVIRIDEQMYKKKTRNQETYCSNIAKAINGVRKLGYNMFPYFILVQPEDRKIWAMDELMNWEIALLEGVMKKEKPNYRAYRIQLYNKDMICRTKFLFSLRELHKMTFEKVPYLPNSYMNSLKIPITRAITKAFRNAYDANMIYPRTKSDIARRKDSLDKAIAHMVAYEDYLVTLLLLTDYGGEEIDKMCALTADIQKMLHAVIKADIEKAKSLPD